MMYQADIGLEIHVQLGTRSKAFSGSEVTYGSDPNSLTDPTVLGLPGALPRYNQAAFEKAVKLGIACGSAIRQVSRFARKHYFYPDLPKGYQITQDNEPLCEGGVIEFYFEGKIHRIPLIRIHVEEDAGKSMHIKGGGSNVDLNRAGVALCEIVTEPKIKSAKEASEAMRAIRRLVRALEISEGDLEKGHIRCDANVSIRRPDAKELGTRTEMKNINSFRFVEQAIESEIARQKSMIAQGETIQQQTRSWDPETGQSMPMRSKEDAEDYRYFPDPDLPPLVLDDDVKSAIEKSIPLLPVKRFAKYVEYFGLSDDTARFFLDDVELAAYFDETCTHIDISLAEQVAHWLQGEFVANLKRDDIGFAEVKIKPQGLASLLVLIKDGAISGKIAKKVFKIMWESGEEPNLIVEKQGFKQVSDPKSLEKWIADVIEENSKQVEEFRAGKTTLISYFVGQVMKKSKGQANPGLVNKQLQEKLSK